MEATPLVLVSGFGSFEAVARNPSGEIAAALAARPPRGVQVRAAVLPVSFARAPAAWDELLVDGECPALYLGLGVAKRAGFRLERWARPQLKLVPRSDVDGQTAHAFSRAGPRLESRLALTAVLDGLRQRGVRDARISRSAGGYVCERIYYHLLLRAIERGVPGLFVHVPPERFADIPRQIQVIEWVIEEALRSGAASPQSSSSQSSG